MDLILITNETTKAQIAQKAGVDRIMVDLEIIGKVERQGHLNTVISRHCIKDIARLRPTLNSSTLMVRINPMHEGSEKEINDCIQSGAEILMLPMFTSREEVEKFINLVRGRARTCLLLETPQALARADDIFDVSGIDEVHVGLNDLHLGLGLTFMFELLASGVVEWLASLLTRRGIKFGFGGVARLDAGALNARLVLSEHVRIGSTQVILSREFHEFLEQKELFSSDNFFTEVKAVRDHTDNLKRGTPEQLSMNRLEMKRVVHEFVSKAQHEI